MKLNELLSDFGIWTSNEEHELLETITEPRNLESFEERQQTIVNQLVRKSLLIKLHSNGNTYVYPNN